MVIDSSHPDLEGSERGGELSGFRLDFLFGHCQPAEPRDVGLKGQASVELGHTADGFGEPLPEVTGGHQPEGVSACSWHRIGRALVQSIMVAALS